MAVMTYAQAAALALQREMEADAAVVVLGEDVGRGGIFGQYRGLRERFGGQGRVPMVVRMPVGIWDSSAAQHSQSLESWFAHMPGLESPDDAAPARS